MLTKTHIIIHCDSNCRVIHSASASRLCAGSGNVGKPLCCAWSSLGETPHLCTSPQASWWTANIHELLVCVDLHQDTAYDPAAHIQTTTQKWEKMLVVLWGGVTVDSLTIIDAASTMARWPFMFLLFFIRLNPSSSSQRYSYSLPMKSNTLTYITICRMLHIIQYLTISPECVWMNVHLLAHTGIIDLWPFLTKGTLYTCFLHTLKDTSPVERLTLLIPSKCTLSLTTFCCILHSLKREHEQWQSAVFCPDFPRRSTDGKHPIVLCLIRFR